MTKLPLAMLTRALKHLAERIPVSAAALSVRLRTVAKLRDHKCEHIKS
jgi:hypothetical protein